MALSSEKLTFYPDLSSAGSELRGRLSIFFFSIFFCELQLLGKIFTSHIGNQAGKGVSAEKQKSSGKLMDCLRLPRIRQWVPLPHAGHAKCLETEFVGCIPKLPMENL